MGVPPSLVAKSLTFLGVGLFEGNALALGKLNQFNACCLQQLAVCGVRNGLLLNGRINNDSAELILGDELQSDGHFDGAGQHFFDTFFANQFAKLHQLRGITRPTVFKVFVARKVLPRRCLAPALNDIFITLIEGVLEVQQ